MKWEFNGVHICFSVVCDPSIVLGNYSCIFHVHNWTAIIGLIPLHFADIIGE